MKQKDLLFLLISAFFLTLFWIGFNIYHSHATPTVSGDVQAQILPITPSFDTAVINDLKQRKSVEGIFKLQPSGAQTPTITPPQQAPLVTPVIVTSPTPEITPSETATPEGSLNQ